MTVTGVFLVAVAASVWPFYSDLEPSWLFLVTGILAAAAAVWAAFQINHKRMLAAFTSLLIGVVLIHLLYLGHFVPPLNAYLSGKPFYEEARRYLGPGRVGLFHCHLALSSYYLDRPAPLVLNSTKEVQRAIIEGDVAYLVADPRFVPEIEGLKPLLTKTVRSPFGKERPLTLYRLSEPDSSFTANSG
jgi:hypothetical protein